jgi:hypothetical protein
MIFIKILIALAIIYYGFKLLISLAEILMKPMIILACILAAFYVIGRIA